MDGQHRPTEIVLATFNTHLGIDGWGRQFDLVAESRSLDADILILQESWAPDDGTTGTAATVAQQLGYTVVSEVGLAHIKLLPPRQTTSTRWGPPASPLRKTYHVDQDRPRESKASLKAKAVPGEWSLAMLSRIPVTDVHTLTLKPLRRDQARRRVVLGCTVELEGGRLEVFGTHMSHITHGSHLQYRRLRGLLPPPTTAAVLAGDMNLWGPPVNSYLRGWRRAIKARTWPSTRPHSQLDHVLVTPPVAVLDARVGAFAGSDHLPVVVTLGLTPTR
jgi:endonuclease/exonuclease/phosphatase family metal-dependent hydrolase